MNVRKASRMISQAYDAALQPSGLRNTQFSLLTVLANNGPLPVTGLARLLGMDRTTLTRNLGVMTRTGLVATRAGDDSRIRLVHLTEVGRTTLDAALPYWENAQQTFLARFGAERWERMLADLTAARHSLETMTGD